MANLSEWIDRGVAVATSLPPMFAGGWGPPELLEALIDRSNQFGPPAPIQVEWSRGHQTRRGIHVFQGSFATPNVGLPLPEESRIAHFQMLLPPEPFKDGCPPMMVHLAGTGDFTYRARRALAEPLVAEAGIGAAILQNPFYGERKPEGQRGTKLRYVTDQFLMNLATVEETRALLRWFREDGYARLGVTGYSMGGYMAAMTAQKMPFPLAVVPCATGNSSAYPLVTSPLYRMIDWPKLSMELPAGESARVHLAKLMEGFAIDRHGSLSPDNPAILVAALHDEFIPREEVKALQRHWPHAEIRWIDGGHTTGWALHGEAIRDAIGDTVAALEPAHDPWRMPAD
jgi:dienelactone hydrolase